MLEFEIYINNSFVNSQSSDGVIIATPTGSTAYSLSSGGPIIHPSLPTISIVSICPHTLSNRPLIVDNNSEIKILISSNYVNCQISLDGQSYFPVLQNQIVKIKKYHKKLKLLHPENYDYFDVIRSKLKWGDKLS